MAGLFSRFDSERIVAAIAKAERESSGEVRVHLTSHKPDDLEVRAVRRFQMLGMDGTRERNGVLIYVAPRIRRFRIIGDAGIHEKCGPDFWKEVAAAMEERFRRGEFTEALVEGVERVGDVLARHFPRGADDRNELPNQVTED
jgi:uncharacterized membrane protein